MSNFLKRRTPRGGVFVESGNHGTAQPILTVCMERGGALVYGTNSAQLQKLSTDDVGQIMCTLTRIFVEKTFSGLSGLERKHGRESSPTASDAVARKRSTGRGNT